MTEGEFHALVEAAQCDGDAPRPTWPATLKALLGSISTASENADRDASALWVTAQIGEAFAWSLCEARLSALSDKWLTVGVRRDLAADLRRTLLAISGDCFAAVEQADLLARASLSAARLHAPAPTDVTRRAEAVFKSFPVLAKLWAQTLEQWCGRTAEFLGRLSQDRSQLEPTFFAPEKMSRLRGVKTGLSDPHRGGRTAMLLRFDGGSVVYKPRSGDLEEQWARVLRELNQRSFRPRLRTPALLLRNQYHWMEYIPRRSCDSLAALRRFYRRAGALAGVAHLLRAVDCHRGNVIAAGEHPVLIDAEALLHPDPTRPASELTRSGFFSDDLSSSASQAAVFAASSRGPHLPRLSGYANAADFVDEIVNGFTEAVSCLLRSNRLAERLDEISRLPRRRIYRASRAYAAICQMSLAPELLRSGRARMGFLQAALRSSQLPPRVAQQEAESLSRLDIPLFHHRRSSRNLLAPHHDVRQLADQIRAALSRRPVNNAATLQRDYARQST